MSGPEALLAFFVLGGGFWVLRPLASAAARRIGGEVPPARDRELDGAVQEELHRLRSDVNELAERLDFAERLLARQRDADRLVPPG